MSNTKRRQSTGLRDQLIALIPVTQSRGASGFPVETDETPSLTLWAYREDLSGSERFVSSQLSAPFTARWIVPFADVIDPDLVDVPKAFVLEHKGRRHDITAAVVVGRRDQIELMTLARKG